MKNMNEKKVVISGNKVFMCYNTVLIVILVVSIIISIIDKVNNVFSLPYGYENVISVSSQIIITIISLVVSIIGIAISLQNEDFFGVKITKIYALRVNKHYSILEIILISIFLSLLNLTFYMLGLTIAAIGSIIVSFLFLLKVVYDEVPIMSKKDDAMLYILKNNLISCYLNNSEASKDLKDAIKYLLYNKNLKLIFEFFKDDYDKEYNQYIFIKLLEFQHDLAVELKEGYTENERKKIGSALLDNVIDTLLSNIKISNEIYSEVSKNKSLLTGVLLNLNKIFSMKKEIFYKISGLFQSLSFTSTNSRLNTELISDIIIIIVAETVKEKDFGIIKSIRHQLSNLFFTKNSPALDIFQIISMYLYYLCCSEPDCPTEIKNDIINFINEGNIIEDKTKITSWKNLFIQASKEFNVDYNNFIFLTIKNSVVLEYFLFGNGAKPLIIDRWYLSKWFLTHLFNTKTSYTFDFCSLINKYPDIKPHLKNYGNMCLDENNNFVPTPNMKKIIEFYNDKSEQFMNFKINEERSHSFFKCINDLKYEELINDSKQAVAFDDNFFAKKIQKSIEDVLQHEWGLDSKLPVDGKERFFSILFEKEPNAINFEEYIIDYCVDSTLADIKKSTEKTVVYNDNQFETNIRNILCKKPQYITESTKDTIPYFFINDKSLKEEFIDICKHLTEFKSRILGEYVISLDNTFKFNYKIEKVVIRKLSEDELSQQVVKHQRADGQFVYKGVFLPREKIIEIINLKYVVLNIVIKHNVISSKETIFELDLYSSKSTN